MDEIERLKDYDLRKLGIPFTLQPKGMWRLDPAARRMYDLLMDFQEPIQEDREANTWDYIGKCTLSNKEMTEILGCEVRTVRRGLSRLEELGFITTMVIRGETTRYINNRPARNMQLGIEKHLDDLGSSRHFLPRSYWKEHKDEYDISEDPYCAEVESEDKKIHTLASETTINGVSEDTLRLARTSNINNKNEYIYSASQRVDEPEAIDESSGDLLAFSPAGAVPSPYSPPPSNSEDTYDSELANVDIPPSMTKEQPLSKQASSKLRGAARLRDDPASANARDVIAYFEEGFALYYHKPCMTSKMNTPQLRSIIAKGFMEKYPYKEWTKLIDGLIRFYMDLPISRSKYPYPSLMCLTQPWLMSLVSAALDNETTKQELKQMSDKAKEISASRVKLTMDFMDYVEEQCGEDTLRYLMKLRDTMSISSINRPDWVNKTNIPGNELREMINSVRLPA